MTEQFQAPHPVKPQLRLLELVPSTHDHTVTAFPTETVAVAPKAMCRVLSALAVHRPPLVVSTAITDGRSALLFRIGLGGMFSANVGAWDCR